MKKLKVIVHLISSNLLLIIIGIFQSFILPKILEPLEYGKWINYILYTNYAGLLNIGFCDGIYLEYGGKSYKDLNLIKISNYYYSQQVYLCICLFIWLVIVKNIFNNNLFLLYIGITYFFMCNRDFFMALNTATNRLNIHAIVQPIVKIVIILGVILCFFKKENSADFIIKFNIIGWIITYIINFYYNKKIILTKPKKILAPLKEYFFLCKTGLYLTFSSIIISFFGESGKFFISLKMSLTDLGYYSFVFSISGLFIQIFSVLSLVFYPLLKNKSKKNVNITLRRTEQIINIIGLLLLPLYYPIRLMLEILFPQYNIGMDNLIFIFPIIVIQSKMNIIFLTIYKIWRLEKEMLKTLTIGVIISLIITFLGITVKRSIFIIAGCNYISFVLWNIITIVELNKIKKLKWKYNYLELTNIFVFILINIFFKFTLISFILTLLEIIITLYIRRIEILKLINYLIRKTQKIKNYS